MRNVIECTLVAVALVCSLDIVVIGVIGVIVVVVVVVVAAVVCVLDIAADPAILASLQRSDGPASRV
jgi:hypothetical protein